MPRALPQALLLLLLLLPWSAQAQEEAVDPEAADPEVESQEVDKPDDDRITFDVRLAAERGGGRVTGWAGNIELREGQYLLATDGVELKFRDLILQADSARVDIPTNLLTAEGNVILDEGPQRLTGDTLEYDLTTQTGRVTQATAYVDPDYYFSGSQIAKVGDQTYTISDGVFTSCEQDVPSWSIHLRDARVTLEEYAHIRHARLKFKRLPVLYAPYLLWPATTERASGFLVPKPGYSRRRGAHIGMAYYKTLGRSADTTFFLDLSTKEYFGVGNEIRYRPSENSEGYFKAYYLFEPELDGSDATEFFNPLFDSRDPGDDRWKVEFHHESEKLWNRFRGVVNFVDYSDFDYLKDFERNVGRQTNPMVYSNAFLTTSSGNYSFNVMGDQRERVRVTTAANNAGEQVRTVSRDTRRQLPEVEFRLRPTRLGNSQVYFSVDSALHYLSIERSSFNQNLTTPSTEDPEEITTFDEQYGRAHIRPTFSIPVSTLSWLSAKLELGGRATYYSESFALDEDDVRIAGDTSGGSRSRVAPEATFEIIGPVFSKIFEKKNPGRYSKLKHIIEPRITYSYLDTFDEQEALFNFDEIDSFLPTNGVTFSFINRLMAKPSDPEEGSSFEMGSFELRQSYSLDDDLPLQGNDKEGPIRALLRINPSRSTSVRADLRYNTLFNQLQSLSFTGDTRFGGTLVKGTRVGGHRLGLTWNTNWNASTGEKTSDQMRLFTRFSFFQDRLTFDAQVTFNLEATGNAKSVPLQRYFLKWKSQCYDWQLELRESTVLDVEERDVLFSLNLKNVGTFLDLNESF